MAESEQIRAARRALGRLLAQHRQRAGFSQHQFAPRTNYGRSTVANVETGRQAVPREFWMTCDELLAAGGQLLEAYDQLQALAARDRWEAAQRDVDILPATSRATGVDLMTVAGLRERVAQFTAAYDTAPSVSLLAGVSQCQARIASLRDHATAGRVRRELCGVEADASILMGQLVWDASQRRDHSTTLTHFDHAIAMAQQINDAAIEAHATLRKSYVALYGTRKPAIGLALADQAARRSHRVSPTLTGLALLHVAEAHGFLGNRTPCEKALEDAQDQLTRHDDMDVAASFFPPTQYGRLAGSCYLSLNEPATAQNYLEQTIHAMGDREKVSAIVLGNLTLAYLRQRKLDEGTATLHAAIDEVERTRGGGGLNIVFAAGRELRPWRHEPAVQDVHDRLLALMA